MKCRYILTLCISLWLPLILSGQDEQKTSPQEPAPGIRPSEKTKETDKTARKIIELHLKARGGKAALRAIETLQLVGDQSEGQTEHDLNIRIFPHEKILIERERHHLGWHHLTRIAWDGKIGWQQELQPDKKNPETFSKEATKQLQFESSLPTLLLDWEAHGHQFSYQGKAEFADRPAYVLRGHLSFGIQVDLYFDQKSFQILNYRVEDEFAGKPMTVNRLPTGLRKFDGVWLETGYDFRLDGKRYKKINYETVRINPDLEAEPFSAPKKREIWLKGR